MEEMDVQFQENEVSSNSDSDSVGWEELETEQDVNSVKCLFCSDVFDTVPNNLKHCIEVHNFNLAVLKDRFGMDCYSFIKLINYIRKNKISPDDVMDCNECLWNDDTYYFTVLQDDSWLMFDYQDFFESEEAVELHKPLPVKEDTPKFENVTVQDLRAELKEKDEIIELLSDGMQRMRQEMRKIVGISDNDDDNKVSKRINHPCGQCGDYFRNYDEPSLHKQMIEDTIRTDSYKRAIQHERGIHVKDKTVLDLGCGTGILSLFAAQAGASKVFAVDNSDIINHTMKIIGDNKFDHVISTVKKCIEDDCLPLTEVDVIVSEWMGYFLLFEGMLDSVIYARDRYLKPGGLLMPNRCSMHLCGVYSPDLYYSHAGFWSNVYGFDMSCLAKHELSFAAVELVKPEEVVTSHCLLRAFDLYTCNVQDADFTAPFSLNVRPDATATELTTLVGYFDVAFDLKESTISFSTSPDYPPTHWAQTLFHLPQPLPIRPGEHIDGEITCCKHSQHRRSLEIRIKIQHLDLRYHID